MMPQLGDRHVIAGGQNERRLGRQRHEGDPEQG
jgi:hypothetical protein